MKIRLLLLGCLFLYSVSGAAKTPGDLLIYYGFPSAINGSATLDAAAQEFGRYDFVVVGDCLQEDGSSSNPLCPTPHPDNQNLSNIIQSPETKNTAFFGYIAIGVEGPFSQNLSIAEVERRALLWQQLGVQGILLDQYGYDFGVTRQRQNAIVDFVHSLGLSVVANGFFVDDVFSSEAHPDYNVSGAPSTLGTGDFYLYESHQIVGSQFVPQASWQTKANRLEFFREQIGFQILSTTTHDNSILYSSHQFFYSWYSAAMYEHTATGWGEFNFSAGGLGDPHADFAPFRIRPTIEIGTFISPLPPTQQGSLYQRRACNGVLSVNAEAGAESFSFSSGKFCQSLQTPGELLIYYGFPSLINSSASVKEAAGEFGRYDIVVFGDCIQEDGSIAAPPGCNPDDIPHPDRENVIQIIQSPQTQETLFFGYIGLGVTGGPSQNLDIIEIQRRASLWQQLGVSGILLDQFGFDFGVTRQRQNQAVKAVHGLGLSAIANGFVVEDVFSPEVDPINNPTGEATALTNTDFYLFESHQIIEGGFAREVDWQEKANQLETFRDQIGFKVLSITTNNIFNIYSEDQFFYSWFSAAMYEHAATGWGELFFSASDVAANTAPFRARPDVLIGTFITPLPPESQGSVYQRTACNGILSITATAGSESSDFFPGEFCLVFIDGFEGPG